MNFKSLWDTVGKMFTKDTSTTSKQANDNSNFAEEYNDIQEINFPYIFANKLANLVKNESEIVISDEFAEPSQRVQLLREFANRTWGKKSQIIILVCLVKVELLLSHLLLMEDYNVQLLGKKDFSLTQW